MTRRIGYIFFAVLFVAWFYLIIPTASKAFGVFSYSSGDVTSQKIIELIIIGAAASITGLVLGLNETGVLHFKMKVPRRIVCSSLVLGLFLFVAFVTPSYAYVYEHGRQYATQTIIDTDFYDGFETGSFNAWSGTFIMGGTKATIASNPCYSGNFSAQFSVASLNYVRRAYAYQNLPGLSESAANAHVYITDGLPLSSGQNMWLIQFEGPVGTVLASFGIRGDASGSHWAVQYGNFPPGLAESSVPAPVEGRWYQLKAYFTHASIGRTIILTVDGVEVASLILNTSGSSNIARVRFGMCYYRMNLPATVYVDNVTFET